MPNIVNVKYQQTGGSKSTNPYGLREMQEKAFEYRDAHSVLKLSPHSVSQGRVFDIENYKEKLKAARIYHTEIRSAYINSKYFFVL